MTYDEKRKIKDFLKNNIFKKKSLVNIYKKDIFKFSNIDSISILKLIIQIETKYKIKFTDDDLFVKKFNTIDNITNIILKKFKL
jgi:acyl carrier protein|tara:strand:- start:603 stop:854 length:252 start_codon:yes stop_codon:yes gene_type:complete